MSDEIWKTAMLTPPVFIPSQEIEWPCICSLGVSISPLSTILVCSDSVVFFVFNFN